MALNEVVWHGTHTETSDQHLHIGRFGASADGSVKFVKEGMTADGKGVYSRDVLMPLIWSRR